MIRTTSARDNCEKCLPADHAEKKMWDHERVEPNRIMIYWFGFFPVPRPGEPSSPEWRTSLRPRACDFRLLRFSRNASFSRSCRASFFAAPPVCRSRLSLSSVIVDPLEYAWLNDTTGRGE